MKLWITFALFVTLFILIVMLVCTIKVKEEIIKSFRCKRCKRLNTVLKKKCDFCNERMSKGFVYKSTFFGKRNCKNGEGYFDMEITLKHVKIDKTIWITLIVLNIIALIAIFISA